MLDVYYLENTNRNFNDMYLCYCGFEKCIPLHSFGPAIRPTYLLHYVLEGTGYYYVDDKKYTITKNEGFLITPNTVTFYQADKDDPWTYLWIGIDGIKVPTYLKTLGLDNDNLIFKYHNGEILKEYLMDMLKHHKSTNSNAFKIEGLLFLFFSKIAETSKSISDSTYDQNLSSNNYINKAIEFIQDNYHNQIKVTDIAKYTCLNRSYLTSIFQKHLKMSPQKFLMEFRITKAADLLYDTDLPINNIAYSCGYSDPLAFSKAFKKIKGVSPKGYRNNKTIDRSHFLLTAEEEIEDYSDK